MDSTQGRPSSGSEPGRGGATAITAAAYVVLLLLGMLEGLIGSFHYGNGPGVLLAVLFALAIFVTCVLGAYGMRTPLGGLLPAVGWYAVSLLLSTGTSGGSVIIEDTSQGKWFLFGGAICAAAGAVFGYVQWSRGSRERRERLASGGGLSIGTARPGKTGADGTGSDSGPRSAAGQSAAGQHLARPGPAGSPARPASASQPGGQEGNGRRPV